MAANGLPGGLSAVQVIFRWFTAATALILRPEAQRNGFHIVRWRVRPQVPVGLPGLLGPELIGHRQHFTVADVKSTSARTRYTHG